MGKRIALVLLWLLAPITLSSAVEGELAIFTLQSRPPQDLLPMLRPVIGEQGAISAQGDKLIVRASSAKLEEIRWLISELDRPARSLMIEVRIDRHDYAREQRFRIGSDERDSVTRGNFSIRERGTATDRGRQQERTLDGRAAFIRVGQAVPQYEVSQSRDASGEEQQSFRMR